MFNHALDAFISYGRVDSKAFAIRLHQYLIERGLAVWLDLDDIPKGVNYQKQIKTDLERSHNVIFVMSPHAVNSVHCRQELDLAASLNKRIIPVLHISAIDQATWQRNYPHKPPAEWEAYHKQNKHFGDWHNPLFHEAVRRINWINFEAANQDFETACLQLLQALERHRDYVEHHTLLLLKALEWQRHQQRSQWLLTGQDLHHARQWLLQPFEDQPPCQPTNLHCEFIAESTKNANNLMTQVFLAYAATHDAIVERVRYSLMRTGITVWSSQQDIVTGQDYQQAIQAGIEAADNLVFFITPEALESDHCLTQLTYALQLNKRVIPLLSHAVGSMPLPPALQMLQCIDLTDPVAPDDHQTAIAELLRVLNQDADYHRDHKYLLVKALKWQRQQQNPGILLRGYNLRAAEAWLKTAQRRAHQAPIPIQVAFIQASLQQPPEASLDVFISYSRSDSEFARKLNDALQEQGKKTWFDQESIAAGTPDFEQEIDHGIEMADNFLFVLSPQAIHSPYCDREVEYAASLNKRLITVLHQPIKYQDLHPELAKVQWIDFSQADASFYQGFNQVIRILETDRDHVQRHTQISLQALAWQQKGQSPDLLLRGAELEAAKNWCDKTRQGDLQPQATTLQKAFVQASAQAAQADLDHERQQQRRLKVMLGLVSVALVGAVGVSIYALGQKQRAETFLRGQIELLSDQSQALVKNDQNLDALLQATHAGQLLAETGTITPATEEIVANALFESLVWVKARNRVMAHSQEITAMRISPDGQLIATASEDQTAKFWNPKGQLIHTLEHGSRVQNLQFTPNSQTLVTVSQDRTVTLWTLQGERQWQRPYGVDLWSLDISPDGKLAAIGTKDGRIELVRLTDGQRIRTLSNDGQAVAGISFSPQVNYLVSWAESSNTFRLWSLDGTLQQTLDHKLVWEVMFSPDGQTLASRSQEGTVKLWTLDGQVINTEDLEASVYEFAFSRNSQLLATATSSGTIQLQRVADGKLIQNFQDKSDRFVTSAHEGKINSIHFGPDDQTLITASGDYTAKVWTLEGQELHRFKHQSEVWEAIPSPDGRWIASYDNQYLMHLWRLDYQPAIALKGHSQKVRRAYFSSDGRSLGTAGLDGSLKIWDRQGRLLKTLTSESTALREFQITDDSKFIATAGADGWVKLFRSDGALVRSLRHPGSVEVIQFSPDHRYIATQQKDGKMWLWSFEGQFLAELPDQYSPSFSPDGQFLMTAQEGNVYLWQVSKQSPHLRENCVLEGVPEPHVVKKMKFNHNGRLILAAYSDGTARVWDLDCQVRQVLRHGEDNFEVRDIAMSPDGQRIVTVGTNNLVKVWSADGKLLKTLANHTHSVFEVWFNPDGRSFATAGNDLTVKLWTPDGELLKTLRHQDEIAMMRYSADGRQLLVVHGQTPTLWNLDSPVLADNTALQLPRAPSFWGIFASGQPFKAGPQQAAASDMRSHVNVLMAQACSWLGPFLAGEHESNRDEHLCQSARLVEGP